jgi:ParB family chromosome partitioning protein
MAPLATFLVHLLREARDPRRGVAPDERLAIQLVENALREDLRPVEQARAYRSLMDARGWTMTDLAAELSVHQTSVSRALALLDLPCTVQEQVEQGALPPATAYEISKAEGTEIARRAGEHRPR